MHIKITLGLIIAIALIFFWWHKDHPADTAPAPVPVKATQMLELSPQHINFNAA